MTDKHIMALVKNYYELKSKKMKLIKSHGKDASGGLPEEVELLNQELKAVSNSIKTYNNEGK